MISKIQGIEKHSLITKKHENMQGFLKLVLTLFHFSIKYYRGGSMIEGMEKKLNPGEVLFNEGDKGRLMYLIREGKIKITKGKGEEEKVLAVLKEGDFFGEMAIIDGSPRSASAIAVTLTSLLVIVSIGFFTYSKRQLILET